MKSWLFILPVVLLFGCTEDALIPCESDDGPSGKLCREYKYFNNYPQGFVEFEHLGDSVVVSSLYSQQSVLEKTVREQFDDGRTIVFTEQFPNNGTRVQSYHYNEMDSLNLIVFGPNDSSISITYQEGKRYRETTIVQDAETHYRDYRYFQDDGMLYRISEYTGDSMLLSYRNFSYVTTNEGDAYRVTYYSAEHELIGRRRFSFSQNGLISSMEFRLADGTVAESKEYIYDGAGKLTEQKGQQYSNTSKSVYLYY